MFNAFDGRQKEGWQTILSNAEFKATPDSLLCNSISRVRQCSMKNNNRPDILVTLGTTRSVRLSSSTRRAREFTSLGGANFEDRKIMRL